MPAEKLPNFRTTSPRSLNDVTITLHYIMGNSEKTKTMKCFWTVGPVVAEDRYTAGDETRIPILTDHKKSISKEMNALRTRIHEYVPSLSATSTDTE